MAGNLKIGLALGAGAARGSAHIGVIRTLLEAGIDVDVIAGTSIGALLGGMYANSLDIDEIETRARKLVNSPAFEKMGIHLFREKTEDDEGVFNTIGNFIKKGLRYTQGVTGQSMITEKEFDDYISEMVDEVNIENLKIPFGAVAVDLNTGEEIIFTQGNLRKAVSASCAIPGIFPPLEADGRVLVDGGWVNSVPVEPARTIGADFVIAVDISREIMDTSEFKRGYNIYLRTLLITQAKLRELQVSEADIVIRPDVSELGWADFDKVDLGIELGKQAAEEKLPEILAAIKKKKRSRLLTFIRE